MIKWYDNKPDILNKEVTENFNLSELRCKCFKCNLTALDDELLNILSIVRIGYNKPIRINSAYRCQQHNREDIHGALYSYHMKGQAVDIYLPIDKDDRNKLIELCKSKFPCTRVYDTMNFIHCDIGAQREW